MMNESQQYRIENEKRLLKQHGKMMAIGEKLLVGRYGRLAANDIMAQTVTAFEQLLPEIPYIGGKVNPMTDTLEQKATLLALYRVLKGRGRPVEEIGELLYRMGEAWVEQYPKFVRQLIGRFYMSGFQRRRSERQALRSQEGVYSADFVTEVVDGEGQDFEWGVNYLECGVVKYFAKEGAEELTPYMCQIDYLLFPAIGINLVRSGTIAQGCAHCDFRFKREGEPTSGWPPPFWESD
jgi:hypothetical protein